MNRRKFLIAFVVLTVSLAVGGILLFNWYVNSSHFHRRIDQLADRLKGKGIAFDSVRIDPGGRISIKNFRFRIPGSDDELVLEELSGQIDFASLATGKVRTTLDATALMRKLLARKYPGRVRVDEGAGKLFLSLESKLGGGMQLGQMEGVLRPENFKLLLSAYPKTPVAFKGGELAFDPVSIHSDGLDFDFGVVRFRFRGSIRDYMNKMEFIGAKVGAKCNLKHFSDTVVRSFSIPEVSRKISFDGDIDFDSELRGNFANPEVRGVFRSPNFRLNFRGQFREIDNHPKDLVGDFVFKGTVEKPEFEVRFASDAVHSEYWEIAQAHRKHLQFNADRCRGMFVFKDARFDFKQMVFDAYEGKIGVRGNWDFSENPVRMKGDVFYRNLSVARVLGDVSDFGPFWDGRVSGYFKGHTKTLMLEYPVLEGKFEATDLVLKGIPRKDLLETEVGADLVRRLIGLRLESLSGDCVVDHAWLDVPQITGKGSLASVQGSFRYNVLTLAMIGGFETRLLQPFFAKHPAMAERFRKAGPFLQFGLGGRINEADVQWKAVN